MRVHRLTWIAVFLMAAACGGENGDGGAGGAGGSAGPGDELRSSLQREEDPGVTGDARAELSAGNTAFAVDMYHALGDAFAGRAGSRFGVSRGPIRAGR